MKILIMEWPSFGLEDIKEAYIELGYELLSIPFDNHGELHHDERIENGIKDSINSFHPDYLFSFNYFPIISSVCNQMNIPYVSWVYDSPQVLMYSYTIINPCNIVFTFDKAQYNEFHNNRISTVHYMPLAANTERLEKMTNFSAYEASHLNNQTDIAFIGSLYTESHQFYNRLKGISQYTQGYLEGIIATQKKIYGYNFVESILKNQPDVMDDMSKYLPLTPDPTSVVTKEYLFAHYVINRQITAIERTEFLSSIGQKHRYDLYTQNPDAVLPGAVNHGKIDYYDMAPYVFKRTKINLNLSLRSITSGIPLRCFDILGSGGFLLTNYQEDFSDCYIAGEDYIYFEDVNDLNDKIDYYLSHENERKEIAQNGFIRTAQNHTYKHRIAEIETYL